LVFVPLSFRRKKMLGYYNFIRNPSGRILVMKK
jgi:hypothetical protein